LTFLGHGGPPAWSPSGFNIKYANMKQKYQPYASAFCIHTSPDEMNYFIGIGSGHIEFIHEILYLADTIRSGLGS
jgi:hypothetical protein